MFNKIDEILKLLKSTTLTTFGLSDFPTFGLLITFANYDSYRDTPGFFGFFCF
jgi:hypothetical protein